MQIPQLLSGLLLPIILASGLVVDRAPSCPPAVIAQTSTSTTTLYSSFSSTSTTWRTYRATTTSSSRRSTEYQRLSTVVPPSTRVQTSTTTSVTTVSATQVYTTTAATDVYATTCLSALHLSTRPTSLPTTSTLLTSSASTWSTSVGIAFQTASVSEDRYTTTGTGLTKTTTWTVPLTLVATVTNTYQAMVSQTVTSAYYTTVYHTETTTSTSFAPPVGTPGPGNCGSLYVTVVKQVTVTSWWVQLIVALWEQSYITVISHAYDLLLELHWDLIPLVLVDDLVIFEAGLIVKWFINVLATEIFETILDC